jgi:D-Tyr-tRNAtyr deacylase
MNATGRCSSTPIISSAAIRQSLSRRLKLGIRVNQEVSYFIVKGLIIYLIIKWEDNNSKVKAMLCVIAMRIVS